MFGRNLLLGLVLVAPGASGFLTPSHQSSTRGGDLTYKQGPAVSSSSLNGFFGDFKGVGELFKPKEAGLIETKYEPVVIDPDYRIGALFLACGLVLDLVPYLQLIVGPFVTLLGVLFLVQAKRIRFVFDETALELATVGQNEDELKSSGENVVVGGANRWETSSIVNYDFFPNSWMDAPFGPILVYFKETQTPQESWNEGPGKAANDPEKIASGAAVAGQVHFFPAVCNAEQIREEFEKRKCGKITV